MQQAASQSQSDTENIGAGVGGIGGAAAGLAVGSIFGPLGMAIGAVVGARVGAEGVQNVVKGTKDLLNNFTDSYESINQRDQNANKAPISSTVIRSLSKKELEEKRRRLEAERDRIKGEITKLDIRREALQNLYNRQNSILNKCFIVELIITTILYIGMVVSLVDNIGIVWSIILGVITGIIGVRIAAMIESDSLTHFSIFAILVILLNNAIGFWWALLIGCVIAVIVAVFIDISLSDRAYTIVCKYIRIESKSCYMELSTCNNEIYDLSSRLRSLHE
jgi:hypothetical protein